MILSSFYITQYTADNPKCPRPLELDGIRNYYHTLAALKSQQVVEHNPCKKRAQHDTGQGQ